MMILRRFFSMPYSQILVLLTASLFIHGGNVSATTVISPGSTTVISIDPVLPKQGEPFAINITGQWRDSCIPGQSGLTYEMFNFTQRDRPEIKGVEVKIKTTLDRSNYCGGAFNPTTYHLSVPVQSLDWNAVSVTLDITDPQNLDDHIYWQRQFDLILGLHEIPPRLGSGYWLSEDTPYQGLLIQQQSSTMVFYELTYNRTSGEPNWLYATGKFHGNSLNGVAYLVNWLSPVEGATQGFKNNPDLNPSIIPYNRLVQPTIEELIFDPSSAGIRVRGVNRIQAYLGLHDVDGEPQAVYHTYKRWVFALDDVQLPPVVPDMIGLWGLYGFNGQSLEQSHQIEFRAGSKVGSDLYRFTSADDAWVLDCQINLDGEGDCTLANEGFGLSMNYYLDKTPYDSSLGYFNGNYAKAPLVNSNGAEPDQTGILLRSGVHLPVLDLQ